MTPGLHRIRSIVDNRCVIGITRRTKQYYGRPIPALQIGFGSMVMILPQVHLRRGNVKFVYTSLRQYSLYVSWYLTTIIIPLCFLSDVKVFRGFWSHWRYQKPLTRELCRNLSVMTWLSYNQWPNSFSNECLGSYNDEERSEMRYVMRIARSASHQNFERSLHFLVECVCWSVCGSPTHLSSV